MMNIINGMDSRTRALLEAPITTTLLRMAWPNILVMVAQAATGLIETWFVSRLGTDALAGMALVFPGFMLMQMLSGGAVGGGISSAIARALGAGRRQDADALVLHAILVNVALGVVFSGLFLAFGAPLYRAMGGEGASLRAALDYSNLVFAGAVLVWFMNALASVLRGTGNMLVPSLAVCGGVILLVPLSPLLIFGFGPLPGMGIAGGAVAVLLTTALSAAVLAWYLWSGRSVVRPCSRACEEYSSSTFCASARLARSIRCRPRWCLPWRPHSSASPAAPPRSPATAPAHGSNTS